LLERVEKAYNITVVTYANQSADEIAKLAKGKDKVVLIDVPQELQSQLEGMNITVRYIPREPGESDHAIIVKALGLYGPYSLGEGLAAGEPQQDVQITGSAPDRLTAEQEASTIYTVLKSGSLPVKLNVVGMQFICW
jgi:preprotein translocase subunit SecD